jgi:pyridinium-3,5-biscarboxylic acid mononucleotide sulfurtransferase
MEAGSVEKARVTPAIAGRTSLGNLSTVEVKREKLREILRAHSPLLIAYSGGVDSTYLLAEAKAEIGDRAIGVIADSPSLPRAALAEALAVARSIGAAVEVVQTQELENPDYAANPPNRCYFCKAELFRKLDSLAEERGYRAIAYGENYDDMRQERPGRVAASEFQVIAPLRDAGLTKAEIRAISRDLGLPTADAPAQPCLSSRIPWGTPVTPDALGMVERAEEAVRARGFQVFRVRHIVERDAPPRARLLVAPAEMERLSEVRGELEVAAREAGYAALEIDLAGYLGPSI